MDIKLSKPDKTTGQRTHLIFEKTQYNEFGASVSSQTGALKIDPAKAEKALAWAKTQTWEFVGEPNRDGFYAMANTTAAQPAPASTEVAENEVVK